MRLLRKYSMLGCMLALSAISTQAQDTLKITLKDAIQVALNENPTIKIAGTEIQLKKTAQKEAYLSLFPEANLAGSYSRAIQKQSFAMQGQIIKVGTTNNMSGGVTVSLPVFAPALYKAISLTKTDVNLSLEKARSSRLDLINQVTKAFYQLLLAQDSYGVLQKSYKQSEDNYNVIKAKFDQGRVSEYDKISAEVQMRSIKPNVISAHSGVTLAMLQLKVLMGLESDMMLAVDGNLQDYEMAMYSRQAQPRPENVELNNSTLKQLDLNMEALKKTLKLKYTSFMPTLAASFNYNYISMSEDLRIFHYKWIPYSTIGLSLSIPLFRGSNFTQVKQAKLQIKELELNRTNVRRQLAMQAKSYLDNMEASSEQVSSNREAINQAIKGRDIADKRYQVGRGTILELNSSEVALTQAQLVYNQSIFDWLIAKADLDYVMGTEDDFLETEVVE